VYLCSLAIRNVPEVADEGESLSHLGIMLLESCDDGQGGK
jgi:hypothetical protein